MGDKLDSLKSEFFKVKVNVKVSVSVNIVHLKKYVKHSQIVFFPLYIWECLTYFFQCTIFTLTLISSATDTVERIAC